MLALTAILLAVLLTAFAGTQGLLWLAGRCVFVALLGLLLVGMLVRTTREVVRLRA